mgnify:CR=1 FL=1
MFKFLSGWEKADELEEEIRKLKIRSDIDTELIKVQYDEIIKLGQQLDASQRALVLQVEAAESQRVIARAALLQASEDRDKARRLEDQIKEAEAMDRIATRKVAALLGGYGQTINVDVEVTNVQTN